MSYFVNSQVVRRRVWFSAAVTGTPTAQLYVDNVATGSPVNGTGSGVAWAFSLALPADMTTGASVQIEAVATVAATTERRQLEHGSVVVLHTQSGAGTGARTLIVNVTRTSDGAAMPGARVSLVGTVMAVTTLEDGVAQLSLTPNTYTLRVVAPVGFTSPADQSVTVLEGADKTVGVALATAIATISVTAGQVAAIAFVRDRSLGIIAGAKVWARIVAGRATFSGTSLLMDNSLSDTFVATNGSGKAEFALGRQLTYDFEVQVGTGPIVKFRRTMPNADSYVVTLDV